MDSQESGVRGEAFRRPSLIVEANPLQPISSSGFVVCYLDPDVMGILGQYVEAGGLLQSILRVIVVQTEAPIIADIPAVFGQYQRLANGVRFIPHFPFERGLAYEASFDPRPFGRSEFAEVTKLFFSIPREPSTLPTVVKQIFPSNDELPENLLRFYVCFSNPMQRGRVDAEISLIGPDGEPIYDVLYRAPVELWDRSMRYLTILLDPGRLKRSVGPNQELGPPLKLGHTYRLAIGSGLVDVFGRRLGQIIYKSFRVTGAVRERIAVEDWTLLAPVINSRTPLLLEFARPLDWAIASQAIRVVGDGVQSIEGRIAVDQYERRWSFIPTVPWAAGSYRVLVQSSLEDVCGNTVVAAFDRPLRAGIDLADEVANRSISFQVT